MAAVAGAVSLRAVAPLLAAGAEAAAYRLYAFYMRTAMSRWRKSPFSR